MKSVGIKSLILVLGILSTLGVSLASGQVNPNSAKDTTKQDKTSVNKEKNIRNNSQNNAAKDTSISNKKTHKNSQESKSMYLIPDSTKKNRKNK